MSQITLSREIVRRQVDGGRFVDARGVVEAVLRLLEDVHGRLRDKAQV